MSGHQYSNKKLQIIEGMKNGKDEYKEVEEEMGNDDKENNKIELKDMKYFINFYYIYRSCWNSYRVSYNFVNLS